MAYQADIRISVKGAKQLDALSKAADKLSPQIDKANAAFIRLGQIQQKNLPLIANFTRVLRENQKVFANTILSNKEAATAAKNQALAEKGLNNELARRNALLNKARGNRVSAVDKSIARNQRARPKRDSSSGFASFSRDADEILLQGQSSPVAEKIQRTISLRQDEIRLQQALLSLEQKSATVLNEKLEIQGKVNRQTALEVEKKLLRGQSSPLTSDIRGNIGDIKSRRESNILSERKNQFSNVNPRAGGFRSFSARASEIQKTTKAEIALSKSRNAAAQKLKSLESIERRRAKTESFGANFRRFRRGRTSADRAVRGRAASSALIGGGFPLLFGGGPVSALAGGLGGGIGELFGKGGGFAGSIAATAITQTIQQAVTAISELGQALGPFTQDTQAATAAMGLQGSAQEAQLKRIERTQGKTAAFNAAMKMMENRIGESGVRKIQEFGETTRILGTIFGTALLKLQAFAAGVVDFVAKLLAGEQKLKEAEINQVVADAAAGGNKEAQALLNRGTEIQETGFRKTSRGMKAKPNTQGKINELKRDKEIFAIRNKISLANDEITSKSQTLVEEKRKEFELNKKIKNLVDGGMNKALAKSLATVEQTFDEEQKILEQKALQAEEDLRKAINTKADLDTQKLLKDEFLAHTIELGKHNKLKEEGLELTKKTTTETDKVAEAFQRLNETIRNDIKEGIKGLIKGTSTLGDLLNNVADRFLDLALNQALFGNAAGEFTKGKGGGIFGAIAGIFKANGGPVRSGKSFIVGEKGPELFTPGRSGAITPNNKLVGGGSTSVVVNVDASGTDVQGDDSQAKELGTLISVAVQGELIKQQRPGGLLASVR